MTREQFLNRLRIVDDVPRDDLFTVHAQKLADHDADRRVLLAEKNALFEQQAAEIEYLIEHVEQMNEKHAKEIARLRDRERKLTALEAAGVDNWEGYSDAMQMMEEKEHP